MWKKAGGEQARQEDDLRAIGTDIKCVVSTEGPEVDLPHFVGGKGCERLTQ